MPIRWEVPVVVHMDNGYIKMGWFTIGKLEQQVHDAASTAYTRK
jgi:hypothetical protein